MDEVIEVEFPIFNVECMDGSAVGMSSGFKINFHEQVIHNKIYKLLTLLLGLICLLMRRLIKLGYLFQLLEENAVLPGIVSVH